MRSRASSILALLLLSLTFGRARGEQAPPFVRVLDRVQMPATEPATAPDDWRLAFVDVETTGLVPGWHEMIDLGVVLTDLDGVPLDSLWVRIMPHHPERTSPGAAAVNGFDPALWRKTGAVQPEVATERLFAWRRRAGGDHPVLMVAFNSQFDTAFLDQLLRGSGRSWRELFHYFVLDLPSMAWALGDRSLTNGALAGHLRVADEPRGGADHTGLTGAALDARIYAALRRRGGAPDRGDEPLDAGDRPADINHQEGE